MCPSQLNLVEYKQEMDKFNLLVICTWVINCLQDDLVCRIQH